jgi:hypothetical protein
VLVPPRRFGTFLLFQYHRLPHIDDGTVSNGGSSGWSAGALTPK